MAFDWNGISLAYSVDGGSAWTTVGELKSLSWDGISIPTDIDLTTNDDTWNQYSPGTKEPGTITCGVAFDPSDNQEDQLGVLTTGGNTVLWKVVWPDSGSTVWRCAGYLKSYSPGGSHNAPCDATLNVKLTGTPTFL